MGGGLVSKYVLELKHSLTLVSGNCLVWGLEGGKAPSPFHLSLELTPCSSAQVIRELFTWYSDINTANDKVVI